MRDNYTLKVIAVLLICSQFLFSCVEDEGGEAPVYLDVVTEVSTIDFEAVSLNDSLVKSYQIAGFKLTDNVVSTADAPFLISKESNANFTNSVSFTPEEFEAGNPSLYVQFMPESQGEYSGVITHTTNGLNLERKVDLMGIGVLDPSTLPNILLHEDFNYPGEAYLPSSNRATDSTNPDLEGWLKVRAANKDLVLTTTGLSFTGYPETGDGAVIIDRNPDEPGGQTNLLQQNLSEQQNADFVGSYYASFLFKAEDIPTVAGGYNSPLIFASWNPANGASWWTSGFLVQNDKADDADPDNMLFGIRNEAVLELSDKNMEVGKTYLIVLKHEVTEAIPAEGATTATSVASIFVFEEGDNIDMNHEPTPLFVMNNVQDKYYIRSVTLFQENDSQGRYVIDGLRVTIDWEDIFK